MQKTSSLQQFTPYNSEAKGEPLVSVVITTKNEEKNIEKCLKSVMAQTFKNIELIVVDNFSEDKTAVLAKKYHAKVYFKGNERSAQRNYGAKVARGGYLIYLDADMILSPTVIEECIAKCEYDYIDALYIPERIVGDGFWIKIRDFERSFYTGTVIDAVRFIRRDIFLQVGGFDETLIGPEDWDFDRRIRKANKVGTVSVPLYHNEGNFNFKRYLGKKERYSKTLDRYIQKWGNDDPEIRKQLGIRYRLFGVFTEDGHWKKLLRHPIKTVGMYFLRVRVGITYLRSIM